MDANIIFSTATKADLKSIINLLLDDDLGSVREAPINDNKDYYRAFEIICRDENAYLFVGKHQGNIIACAQLNIIQYLTYQGGKRAQVEGVRVDKTYRGQGVGQKLFQFLIDFSKAQYCHLLQLTTDKKRPQAYRFYESLGFKNTHDGFKLHF